MKCLKTICKLNTEQGDKLFCKDHRSEWRYVCSLYGLDGRNKDAEVTIILSDFCNNILK